MVQSTVWISLRPVISKYKTNSNEGLAEGVRIILVVLLTLLASLSTKNVERQKRENGARAQSVAMTDQSGICKLWRVHHFHVFGVLRPWCLSSLLSLSKTLKTKLACDLNLSSQTNVAKTSLFIIAMYFLIIKNNF